MNRVSLSGRMANAPQFSHFDNGNKMASFRVGTTKRQFNSATEEWEDGVVWHNIRAYGGNQGGIIKQLESSIYTKGTYVVIHGTLQYQENTITDSENKERRQRIAYIEIRHPQDLEFVVQSNRAIQEGNDKKTAAPSTNEAAAPKYTSTPAKASAPAPAPTLSEADMIGIDGNHVSEDGDEEI